MSGVRCPWCWGSGVEGFGEAPCHVCKGAKTVSPLAAGVVDQGYLVPPVARDPDELVDPVLAPPDSERRPRLVDGFAVGDADSAPRLPGGFRADSFLTQPDKE